MTISIIILTLALAFSVVLNGLFFWYNRTLISRIAFISNNLDDLMQMVTNYRAHLKSVFNMEMFYGDDTLKFLIAHTKDLTDLLEDYENILYITEPIEEVEVDDEQQEEQIDGPTKVQEENVFYAGARRRDS